MLGKHFRAGVGAVIINSEGKVFAGHRIGINNWQMPQGGLEAHEAPLTGVLREIEEETGISAEQLQLLQEYPGWLTYEIPPDFNMRAHYRGQSQKWFLFLFKGTDEDVCLDGSSEKPEFDRWQWMPAQTVLDSIVDFKKAAYKQLFQRFSEHLILNN